MDLGTTGTADYYEPVVISATDYFPFGMDMPGRTYQAGDYRFGFNGKEKDDQEEWGDLTHYDYGFRIYNPGIGRFLSVDPLTKSYPELTPYQFASNTPIAAVDLDGLERFIVTNNYTNGQIQSTTIQSLRTSTDIINAEGVVTNDNTFINGQLQDQGSQIRDQVLVFNVGGQLPPGVSTLQTRNRLTNNEFSILRNGANQRRGPAGEGTKRITPLLGIEFQGTVSGPRTNYERKAGDYVNVPVFETQTITQRVPVQVPFPPVTTPGSIALNIGTGAVSPDPTSRATFQSLANAVRIAASNNVTDLNVTINVVTPASNIGTFNAISALVANNLQSQFGFTGNLNLNFNAVNGGQGGIVITSPGGTITQMVGQQLQRRVQVGTDRQLIPRQ